MAMSYGASNNSNAASCDAKIAGLYDLLDTLGSGHFAVVKLARHVFTGEKVAVKVIDKSKLDEVSKSHLFQEVRCMKLVQHPNVVRLYEVIDTQTKLYLILELGDGGDLYDYIMRHDSGLSETLARDYFRQIVRAISYCHRLHVVHRDLKPENVVFFERLGMVKLTDFGFSNKFYPGQKLETSCGSLAYSAPEILLGDLYDAPAVDVWSLGVILFMLVCGNAPFQEANDSETLTMIMDCKYTIPAHVSNPCKRLIRRMLVREPDKRATLSEIATDPWVTYGQGVSLEDFDAPLVTKEQLTDEDQTLILQKMVSGEMGSKEEILDSLEKDDYNHITATYYLLAERRLRAKRQSEALARRPDALSVVRVSSAKTPGTQTLLLPPPSNASARTPQDLPPRSRKCSIVREEEGSEEEGSVAGSGGRRPSRSEGRLHLAAKHLCKVNLQEEELSEVSHIAGRAAPPPPARRLPAVPSAVPLAVPSAVPRRAPRATSSCSDSDLSEDDSEQKKLSSSAAADVPAVRTRRDSHDDSSDGQERGGGCGGGGAGGRPVPSGACSGGAAGRAGGAGAGAGGDAAQGRGGGGGRGRRRRAPRKEARLRESRSLNRIAEVEEGWAGPLLRLLAAARPHAPARPQPPPARPAQPPTLRPLC